MRQEANTRRKYSKIGLDVRRKLIQRVVQNGYSIASSAKIFKIKLSTAKQIVSKFRKTGRVFNRGFRRSLPREREVKEEQKKSYEQQKQQEPNRNDKQQVERIQIQQQVNQRPNLQVKFSMEQQYFWYAYNCMLWRRWVLQSMN